MKTTARSPGAEIAIVRAAQLAREIDELLRVAAWEEAQSPTGSPYAIRLVQGLVGSVIDQLHELRPSPAAYLATTRPVDERTEERKIHVA